MGAKIRAAGSAQRAHLLRGRLVGGSRCWRRRRCRRCGWRRCSRLCCGRLRGRGRSRSLGRRRFCADSVERRFAGCRNAADVAREAVEGLLAARLNARAIRHEIGPAGLADGRGLFGRRPLCDRRCDRHAKHAGQNHESQNVSTSAAHRILPAFGGHVAGPGKTCPSVHAASPSFSRRRQSVKPKLPGESEDTETPPWPWLQAISSG
jgi:hypothetical protein